MKVQKCSICGMEKPASTEFFYRRGDNGRLRKDCIVCMNDRTRPRRKVTFWYYENTKQLFLDNNLNPLFDEFESRVKAKEKLPALNDEGYKVWISVDKLRRGKRPDAFSTFNPSTIENIKKYLKNKGENYNLLSTEYKNSRTKMVWRCDKGHLFKMEWSEFHYGKRCPECFGTPKKTNEEFERKIYELVGEEYTFLEEYDGLDEKLDVIHNKCGHRYKVTPYKFIFAERRCPKCNESKGERKVEQFLISNNINYTREYSFDDCRHEQPLRFDFAVFDNNDAVLMLIEYDGKQHFRPYEFYGGLEKFKATKHRDRIKDDYCKKKNIKLLRIPYTEYDNIDKILATHLL